MAEEQDVLRTMTAIDGHRQAIKKQAQLLTDDQMAGPLFIIANMLVVTRLSPMAGNYSVLQERIISYTAIVVDLMLKAALIGNHTRHTTCEMVGILRCAWKMLHGDAVPATSPYELWLCAAEACSSMSDAPITTLGTLCGLLSEFRHMCERSADFYKEITERVKQLPRVKVANPAYPRFKRTLCHYYILEDGCRNNASPHECQYAHGYADVCWHSSGAQHSTNGGSKRSKKRGGTVNKRRTPKKVAANGVAE